MVSPESAVEKDCSRPGKRFRVKGEILLAVLIVAGLASGVALLWNYVCTNRCHEQIMMLGMDLYGALHEPAFVQDGGKTRQAPLIFLERTYYRRTGRLNLLFCPSDKSLLKTAGYEHLSDNDVSYTTWDWTELPGAFANPGALLVWEKGPHHGRKRWVFDSMMDSWLVDEGTFRKLFEYSEKLAKQNPDMPVDQETLDRLLELHDRLNREKR
jgi:hypothetical protein